MPITVYRHPRTGRTVRTRLGAEKVGRAVRAYERGATTAEAAELADCSGTGLLLILKRLGLNRSLTEAKRLEFEVGDNIERAGRLYERGLSTRQVADILSVTSSTARRYIEMAGVEFRSRPEAHRLTRRSRRARQKAVEASRLQVQGLSRDEIADVLDVSPTMVSNYTTGPHNPYRNA